MIHSLVSSNRLNLGKRLAVWLLILALSTTGFTASPWSISSANEGTQMPRSSSLTYPAFDSHNYVTANAGDLDTLDPALAFDWYSEEVIQNIYETLVFYDGAKTNEFVPQLADSYDVSVDGLTWTFHIRPGVKFHNGDSLTPADVAYSFQRGLLQGGSNSPQWMISEAFFGVGNQDITFLLDDTGGLWDDKATLLTLDPAQLKAACETVQNAIVADDLAGTVSMHLAQSWGPFLTTITATWGSILDKNWAIANGAWDGSCDTWQNWYRTESADDPLTPIANGTGPFKLENWTPGSGVILARNSNYWRTPAQLEHVSILVDPTETTRFTIFQDGEVDQAELFSAYYLSQADALVGEDCPWNASTAQYDCTLVDDSKPLRRFTGRPGIAQDEIIFNYNISIPTGGSPNIGSGQLDGEGIPPNFFSDVHIRKAFNYCFNWAIFNEQVYGGSLVQPTTLLLEGMPGYDLNAEHYSFDLSKAATEFQASILTSPGGASLWDTGFHFTIPYNEGNLTRQKVAEILADCVANVNPKFVIDMVSLPWNSGTPNYLDEQRAGVIPLMTAGWIEDNHDPHNWYWGYLLGTYANRAHLPDDLKAQFKTLMDQGVSANGFAARDAIYKQLNQLIYDNATFILLGGPTNHIFINRRVHGIIPNLLLRGKYYYSIYKDPTFRLSLPLVIR